MKKLLLVPLVLGVLGVGVEIAAPQVAEGQIETRARERSDDFAAVKADIDSFPMVTRLLATGKVGELTITLDEVVGRQITFARVSFVLRGIELERGALMRREVEVTGIEQGVVRAVLSSDEVAAVLGVAEQAGLDGLSIDVSGDTVSVSRAGRTLFSFGLPPDMFPCTPGIETTGDSIVLTCTFTEVPDIVVRAANR